MQCHFGSIALHDSFRIFPAKCLSFLILPDLKWFHIKISCRFLLFSIRETEQRTYTFTCYLFVYPPRTLSHFENQLWENWSFQLIYIILIFFSFFLWCWLSKRIFTWRVLFWSCLSGVFPGGLGVPQAAKILPVQCPPPTTDIPAFWPEPVLQMSFVPENFKNITSFFSQFWLLFSSKLHQKALFYA